MQQLFFGDSFGGGKFASRRVGRGIGRRLLEEIMKAYPTAKRFQARTGHKSERNLYQLRKLGFKEYKTEPLTPNINWVYLEKICQ